MVYFGLTVVNQILNHMNRIELEERLINFSVLIFNVTDNLPKTRIGYYFSDQIMRSASSSALNFGEAQSAESKRDFIHKIKIVLKELRETMIGLAIIDRTDLNKSKSILDKAVNENNQLIAIFVKSVETAQKKYLAQKTRK